MGRIRFISVVYKSIKIDFVVTGRDEIDTATVIVTRVIVGETVVTGIV